jgi:hypothetical protein
MDAKHQFKYTYNDTTLEEFSPVEVTFEVPGEVTLTQMLYNFQCYLRACGFVFEGSLEIISDDYYDVIEDKDDGYLDPLDNDIALHNEWAKADQKVKEWNKGLEKLQAEVKKQKWVQGMCNPPSPDWKKSDSDNCWNS